jgi:hypothetical protein
MAQRRESLVPDTNRRSRHLSRANVTSELHRLCRNGDLSAVKSYLNEAIIPNAVNQVAGENGCTPLHEAAMAGREDMVRLLKEECQEAIDMDARTQHGPASTALHLAAERGHTECVAALLDCGAGIEAVDRRCRTARDVARENGKRQVVQVIILIEMERAAKEGNLDKLTEVLSQLKEESLLSESVKTLQQEKFNGALVHASMTGNYKTVLLLVEAGANSFAECIRRAPRLNHIIAYLRLCQAAYEDDRRIIQLLLEHNEEEIANDPLYSTVVKYRQVLMPLLDNGKLSVGPPIRVALKANNVLAAGNILLRFSKHPSSGIVDWHGLDLESIPGAWIRAIEYPNLNFVAFSFNKLRQVPSELTKFKNLMKLQVASNQLTFVPSEILELPSLEELDMSFNSISSLPEALLGKLSPVLTDVNLSHNRLARLPAYFKSGSIRHLDISHCLFSVVPECVCGMTQLQSLNLSHNIEISHIPYGIGDLRKMQGLILEGLPYLLNIPPRQECLPLDFLRKRHESMQTVSHFELQIIGSPVSESTVEHLRNVFLGSKLHCSILHFTNFIQFLYLHKVFYLENTVYLVVWDCHNKQHPNAFHRVLRHLAISDPETQVVVAACWKSEVTSKMETAVRETISESLWKDISGQVHVRHVVLDPEDDGPHSVSKFVAFVGELSKSVERTFFIPRSYYECRKYLPQVAKERLTTELKPPMLKQYDFFSRICDMPTSDISSNKELPELVTFLEKSGVLLNIPGNQMRKQSLFVIDRQWFCDVLGHAVSHTSDTIGYRNFTGIVRQEGLIDLLDCPTLTEKEIPDALRSFVNHHSIAIAFSSTQWLVPSMLDAKPDATVPSFFSQFGIRRQYTFALTPITFWGRLISHLVINIENYPKELAHETDSLQSPELDWSYWATGIICSQNGTNLLFCIEAIKASTEPFMEGLEIRAPNTPKGSHIMQTLTFTIESLLRNWYPTLWKTVEIWIPCSYCIHRRTPEIPSVSFSDALQAVSKGVGVKCCNHPEKVVSIAKLIPDLFQHKVSKDFFIPPGRVAFNPSEKSTCLSPPNSETVFKGKFNGSLVAVKLYPHPVPNRANRNADAASSKALALVEMWQEYQAVQTVQSSGCLHLINLLGICQSPLCLVFPFARWCSLEDVIQDKEIYIPLLVRVRMVHQLTSAMLAIHSQHMIHQHICLANILVTSLSPDESVNIKLAGFSEACHTMFQGISKGYHGTFSAPEMSQEVSQDYDERVDIFAFAFVAYEIITRHRIHVNSRVSLLKVLFHPIRPSLAPIMSRLPYFSSFISRCWNADLTVRPFASDVAEFFRDPVSILTRDACCISKKHSFFAGAAKFSRTAHGFNSDIFLCSGALEGGEEATLSHFSIPGLTLHRTAAIPSLYIICMCCIGNQLWVSIYGKKVLVYSTTSLKYKSEFVFKQHVVAMAVSPTQLYLGLENGVLQVYSVSRNTVPTEPILTKVVCQGQDFKCIEPAEDSVVCATKDTIYRLHPDLLHTESQCPITSEAEIRNVVMTSFTDDDDTIWISFRRQDRIEVRKAHSGSYQFTIECSRVLEMMSEDVWVVTMRVVLDTVWVGLNTGHILVFSTITSSSESQTQQPQLLTHFKLHEGNVRQLLLLHPSYMGPSSIERVGETLLGTANVQTQYDEQVYVLSCGEGLVKRLPELSETGTIVEDESANEAASEANKDNLYAVILEGMCESRVCDMESKCARPFVAYMQPQTPYYSVPTREHNDVYSNPAFRTSTWSANSVLSPIESKMKKMHSHDESSGIYESIRHWTLTPKTDAKHDNSSNEEAPRESFNETPPKLPPRVPISRNPTASPVLSSRHLPSIAERERESSSGESHGIEGSGGSKTLHHAPQNSLPAQEFTQLRDSSRSVTIPNRAGLATRPQPVKSSKLDDSCDDSTYDPYVSMVSVMQSRAQSVALPARMETSPSQLPSSKQAPPPVPPKPKPKSVDNALTLAL